MFTIEQTVTFSDWFAKLRDSVGRKQIAKRIAFAEAGHFGDMHSVGDRVSEMRVHTGPGYRMYFTRVGDRLIVLLVAGDKGSQDRDIATAKGLAAALHTAKGDEP